MKDKKWHPTDCSQLTTATAHPLKKPAPFKNAWMRCPRGLLQGTESSWCHELLCSWVRFFSHAPPSLAGERPSPCLFSLTPSSYPFSPLHAPCRCAPPPRLQQA